MPEYLKLSQIGSSPLLPPFRGLHSPNTENIVKLSSPVISGYVYFTTGPTGCRDLYDLYAKWRKSVQVFSTRDAKDLLVKSEWRAGKDRALYTGISPRNKRWWWRPKRSKYKTDIKLTTSRVKSQIPLLRIVLFNLTCSRHTRSLACER